jgi:hypothetical protein
MKNKTKKPNLKIKKHRGIIKTAAGPACKTCGKGVGCWLGPDESPCEHR